MEDTVPSPSLAAPPLAPPAHLQSLSRLATGVGVEQGGSLLEELQRAGDAPSGSPERATLGKIRYTHDAMIDLVIANPWISQNEIAERFGYSVPWVSIVFSSDAFKNRLEERRGEVVDPVIRASLKERFEALVTRSLEVLQAKLSKPSEQVSDALALKTLELGAKALNFGAQAPVVQVQPGARLEALAERLMSLNQPRVEKEITGEVIDQTT
ncbi:MAG TPA: hypothetical protein PKW90_22435 [Myxococcota bacterium]|nr:hypothetical protein [Myxococcota bacterium]